MKITDFKTRYKIRIIFTYPTWILGALITIPSLFLFISFFFLTDFSNHKYNQSDIKYAKGTIKNISKTNSAYNGKKIIKHDYAFDYDSVEINGSSFSVDKSYKVGDIVMIEFISDDIKFNRIVGMKSAEFSIWILLFLLVFLLFGLMLLVRPIKKGFDLLQMLSTGFQDIKVGMIKKGVVPFVRINGCRSLYYYQFEYSNNGTETRNRIYSLSNDKFKQGKEYLAVCKSNNPQRFYPIDLLSARLQLCINEVVDTQ